MRVAQAGRLAAACAVIALAAAATASASTPLTPLDAQNWSWQDNLGWSDYHAIPGPDYSDPSIQPTVKKWKVALVVTDFSDKSFTLSQPAGGTAFGTPTAEANSIPRDQVPTFLRDFLNKAQPLNHYQTMNRYWMEDSFGKYGVQLDVFGPYRMPSRSYQYFEQSYGGSAHCPTPATTPCNKDFRTDAKAAWQAEVGATTIATYDNVFYISAGEDQSSTWQEFGEMKWMTQDEVPDAFGPKAFDPAQTNWAQTRYVPWTSWASASTIWPNAVTSGAKPLSSIEGESSGMGTFAHELTHNLGILDNYSNPFGATQQRGFTGMWDMMSRGSFNGPGGQHTRYMIPPTLGASLGSQHNMRNKLKLGFVTPDQVLRLNRSALPNDGIVVADVKAREVEPGNELAGVQVNLDGTGDNETPCVVAQDWRCDGVTKNAQGVVQHKYNAYTAEVVQQIGSDSFDPGHGVLLAKTKTSENDTCGTASCFVWVIDSHPEDINHVDFVRPDGTPKMATLGDERQLNDASFNAGLNSGSSYEYEDTANRLRFYIVDKHTDAQGVLHYTLGVQSLDGNGPQTRGVALGSPAKETTDGGWDTCTFPLTNTGTAAAIDPSTSPSDVTKYVQSDVYRLSVSSTGAGWDAQLRNALAAAKFGETVQVPVYFTRGAGAGSVTLKATSVSDPSKTVSATCAAADSTVGGSVGATLSLSLGAAASFGSFAPGVPQDYTAQTTANVVSTAGDATLGYSDPGHMTNGAFALAQPLQVSLSKSSWDGPASNDPVTISFKQRIEANDPLRTGTYSKTVTFTLSTTKP